MHHLLICRQPQQPLHCPDLRFQIVSDVIWQLLGAIGVFFFFLYICKRNVFSYLIASLIT